MPFITRLLRCVLGLPSSEKMKIIGQHFVASCFFFLINLFGSRLPNVGLDFGLLSAVIADTKIISQLHGGFLARQSEQFGNKINCISVCLASETMKTLIHFHARISVIVKWTDSHAVSVDTGCRTSQPPVGWSRSA